MAILTIDQQSKKEASAKALLKDLQKNIKKAVTLQESFHQSLIGIVIHAYTYKETTLVSQALNEMMTVKGFTRVESMAYWFKHVAGLNCKLDEKAQVWTSGKFYPDYESDLGIKFSMDKYNLAICKDPKNRFWLVAPKDIKELKAMADIQKSTVGLEAQFARNILIGAISEQEAIDWLNGIVERMQSAKSSKGVKEWVKVYEAQHNIDSGNDDNIEDLDAIENELKSA